MVRRGERPPIENMTPWHLRLSPVGWRGCLKKDLGTCRGRLSITSAVVKVVLVLSKQRRPFLLDSTMLAIKAINFSLGVPENCKKVGCGHNLCKSVNLLQSLCIGITTLISYP